MTAAASCWACRLDRFMFWAEIAFLYAFVASCAFVAGVVWLAGQLPA